MWFSSFLEEVGFEIKDHILLQVGSCEHSNDPSVSINSVNFLTRQATASFTRCTSCRGVTLPIQNVTYVNSNLFRAVEGFLQRPSHLLLHDTKKVLGSGI
jgi:hypothetical protein